MGTARIHLLAVALAVGCCLLVGCVLAEVHATISPVPPWATFDLKGFADTPTTIITATTATEPPPVAATQKVNNIVDKQ